MTTNRVLYELPTGYGKTKKALDYMVQHNITHPLIVIPQITLEDNWNNEITKWEYSDKIQPIYIQYLSFIKPNKWVDLNIDCICFDEAHHLSDQCIKTLNETVLSWNHLPILLLSATISDEQRNLYTDLFAPLQVIKKQLSDGIDDNRLPKPLIVFLKCKLSIEQRALYTQIQDYITDLKKQVKTKPYLKRTWLQKCKQRNVWLAKQKTDIINGILDACKDKYRTITFCADIEQTESFHITRSISSKRFDSLDILDDFNNEKINHISACAMLDEGVNLVNCRCGIFAYLTISDRLTVQRIGRLLRHEKPILYMVYYENTREEEIVREFKQKYENSIFIVNKTL